MEGFRPGSYPQVVRGGASYHQMHQWTLERLQYLETRYQQQTSHDMTTQLIRMDFDNTLRNYHRYVIQDHLGAHYREQGITAQDRTEFEHVIPIRVIREAVFTGRMSIQRALNVPTCDLRSSLHKRLGQTGYRDDTPCPFWFWRRYQDLGIKICTRDGQAVDLSTWNLETHYKHFDQFEIS